MSAPWEEEGEDEGAVLHPRRGWVGVSKRATPGHPGDGVCHSLQYWACERPEDDDTYGVLFHTDCRACVIALQAMAARPGTILMCHGASR